MRALKPIGAAACLAAAAVLGAVAPAQAAFGLKSNDATFTGPDGAPAMQAGSHPFAMTLTFDVNTALDPVSGEVPEDAVKDVVIDLPEGEIVDPHALPVCPAATFAESVFKSPCPSDTALGKTVLGIGYPQSVFSFPVYNLAPPPGEIAKLGFVAVNVPVIIDIGLSRQAPHNGVITVANVSQAVRFYSSTTTVWGNPASPTHDEERGSCLGSGLKCPASTPERPLLTMPRSCVGPLRTGFEADSWQQPGEWLLYESESHDDSVPPSPLGTIGCSKLAFAPSITAKPTTRAAERPTGLDLSVDVSDEGLRNPAGIAQSDIRKAVVTLPEGMTVNPSSAGGLEVCTPLQIGLTSAPGASSVSFNEKAPSCPDASRLGTVEVETPLLEGELLKGSLFLAEPYRNPSGSLLDLYLTIEDPELGILIKLAGKVVPDPRTGQLVSTFDEIPQLAFSHFRLHFREGARSPLVSPPSCGRHETQAILYPWAGGAPLSTTSSFEVISGPGESPCPSRGPPPFGPGFEAGTLSNNAGSFSPFYMRLSRRDGDQDLTKFSAKLPPGVVAKLAQTAQCPDSAIARARARTGPTGGREELASPSCPASSKIGRILAGAGVGAVLTYVPGSLYLAGPYKGAPLSVVAVVPAVVGPFDVGTVVTRQALRIDPRTAEVTVDGESSDPIPHILAGIPLKARDIRVYVDKPQFTLNPTSCTPSAVGATLWGGGSDVFGSQDDSPLSLASRFQAANCTSLAFKPRFFLKLKGGTKRGGHPALTGTYVPRPGDANLSDFVLRLPRSAFLDQSHIRTICTKVQFAAKACPEAAVYGHATAYTPILSQPLTGAVYLRSSDRKLPDLVADLRGLVDVEAVARIDSAQGGIRATFEDLPDAPLTQVVVQMQGAKKGLIVNSRNLCGIPNRANAEFSGQNGKLGKANPLMEVGCGKEIRRVLPARLRAQAASPRRSRAPAAGPRLAGHRW